MSGLSILGGGLALAATLGGVGLLRLAWRRPRPVGLALGGWGLLVAAVPAWAMEAAWDKAVALALLAPSLVAFGLVAAGMEIRPGRSPRQSRPATDLPNRSGEAVWRALIRTAYGGPLSGLAALTVSAAWALKGVGSEGDRVGVALLAAPALWALGLLWAVTDPRLVRIGSGLGAVALAGGLAAVL